MNLKFVHEQILIAKNLHSTLKIEQPTHCFINEHNFYKLKSEFKNIYTNGFVALDFTTGRSKAYFCNVKLCRSFDLEDHEIIIK
jgi:hypothetical protein